jgi:hypothetical protein
VGHVLWECPATIDVWGACGKGLQKRHERAGSFREIFQTLMERCTKDELAISVLVAKKIWARRNRVIHGGDFQHPNHLVCEAMEMWKLHHFSLPKAGGEESSVRNGNVQRWGCPPVGFIKINWDVAIDSKMKSMGFGIVIRDHNGVVRAAKRSRINMLSETSGWRGHGSFANNGVLQGERFSEHYFGR